MITLVSVVNTSMMLVRPALAKTVLLASTRVPDSPAYVLQDIQVKLATRTSSIAKRILVRHRRPVSISLANSSANARLI